MEVKSQIEEQAIAANKAARVLANVSTKVKNDALKAMAEALCLCKNYIWKRTGLTWKAAVKMA